MRSNKENSKMTGPTQLGGLHGGSITRNSTTSLSRTSAQISGITGQQMEGQGSPHCNGSENEGQSRTELPQVSQIRRNGEGNNGYGSGQRKRSRLQEITNMFVKEALLKKESAANKIQINTIMQTLYNQIEQVFAKGQRGKILVNKAAIFETLRTMGMDIFQLLASIANLLDERSALQYQVIQIQSQGTMATTEVTNAIGTPATNTYLQTAMKNTTTSITGGNKLPIPEIPQNLQHAPAEKVIIFKAPTRGEKVTQEQQEVFRRDVNDVIREELMDEVDMIRPTRSIGHTIIFHTEEARDKTLEAFRMNENKAEIEEGKSNIIAPKKKFAKVVYRDPPDDVIMETVLQDLFNKNNVHLHQVPMMHREMRIIDTRFGWIFDTSSVEATAIQAQGGRIRFRHAREMKVEEYIPVQQCYKCCAFGHNAKNCRSELSYCRLCGEVGHAGWDCPNKENRDLWKCTNYIMNNIVKGINLPINHAAAQLHKCPCAKNHKEIRKTQLAAAGVYTSSISSAILNNQTSKQINNGMTHPTIRAREERKINSLQQQTKNRKKSKSRSSKINIQRSAQNQAQTHSSSSTSSAAHEKHRNIGNVEAYKSRMMRFQRPKSIDGWQTAGRRRELTGEIVNRGREIGQTQDGTNNLSNLPMLDIDTPNKPVSLG